MKTTRGPEAQVRNPNLSIQTKSVPGLFPSLNSLSDFLFCRPLWVEPFNSVSPVVVLVYGADDDDRLLSETRTVVDMINYGVRDEELCVFRTLTCDLKSSR